MIEAQKIREVRAVIEAYERCANGTDVKAYIALFDDDVIWAGPGMSPAKSKSDIETTITKAWAGFKPELKIEIERIDLLESIAVVLGHTQGQGIIKESGETVPMNLSVLWVLRRRAGDWKIFRQLWNSRTS